MSTEIAGGVVHEVPDDMTKVFKANKELLTRWNGLTPIQRNEWICWVTIVKKAETRAEHITRLKEDILDGKRSPCCWPGCPHRRPSAKKYFKNVEAK